MSRSAIITGTGFGDRGSIIRRYCKEGQRAFLRREPRNQHDKNAIAVEIRVPLFFGLLGTTARQIGYIKRNTAKSLAKRMDHGEEVTAVISYLLAPPCRDHPKVTLTLNI